MEVIQWIANVIIWVMGILVLIKLFQKEGVLKGILGIICMLYTFIWGWMHYKENDQKTVMMIWSGLIILGIILNGIAQANAA